jgi:hypothetical protein
MPVKYRRCVILPALAFLLNAVALQACFGAPDERRALLVGGGPTHKSNQVAIESNVRYLLRLLPQDVQRTVLFADGDPKSETVLFEERAKDLKPGERLVALLLDNGESANTTTLKYRTPSIAQIDGPAKKAEIEAQFSRLSTLQPSSSPLLLYFTGHGSPARNRNLDNNVYDLWQENGLSVQDLAKQVARLPGTQPVTLVMVQCYSGAFGNLLFRDGDPQGEVVDQDIAGFFATVKERVAAGCTPAVDESEYHDFTSYFFAALTGKDRVGRRVRGADYDRDGRVTMDEAYCYAIIHDESIDIPVCTSDIYLRRIARTKDEDIFKNPYNAVKSWATPAQRIALEDLSKRLKLSGDDRGATAYTQFVGDGNGRGPGRGNRQENPRRAFNEQREEAKRELVQRWPELLDKQGAGYEKARAEAAKQAGQDIKDGKYKALLDAESALDATMEAAYRRELEDALLVRFVRLYKTVVLTHEVRTGEDSATQKTLERIVSAEHRQFFAPDPVAAELSAVGDGGAGKREPWHFASIDR